MQLRYRKGWSHHQPVLPDTYTSDSRSLHQRFQRSRLNKDHAVTVSPYDIRPAVKAYTDQHYAQGESLPVSLLVQFDRGTGRFEVTFEDTDEDRWRVTPATFSSIRDELRPNFS